MLYVQIVAFLLMVVLTLGVYNTLRFFSRNAKIVKIYSGPGRNPAYIKYIKKILLCVILVGIFLLGGVGLLIANFNFNIELLTQARALYFCLFAIIVIGVVLFLMRKYKQIYYGVFEMLTALLIGGFTIINAPIEGQSISLIELIEHPNGVATMLGLMSSIYIVVRGLDDIEKGIEQRQKRSTTKGP